MSMFTPVDPDFKARVRSSFERQQLMRTLNVSLVRVNAGEVELELKYQEALTQQHGFLHAGIVASVLDSACGYAAFSLMPMDRAVLTIEYKINFVSPARGDSVIAAGKVLKPGATITVCSGCAYSIKGQSRKLVASMQSSVMAVEQRPGVTW